MSLHDFTAGLGSDRAERPPEGKCYGHSALPFSLPLLATTPIRTQSDSRKEGNAAIDQSSRVKGSFNFTNAFFHLAVVKKPGTYLYLRGNTRSGPWPSRQTDAHPAGTTLKSTHRTEHRPPSQARTPT